MKNRALVSVLIANYNYGRYLRTCLESVEKQTYDNIEVIMSDNQSTDDSYKIMIDYKEIFARKGIWCDVLQNKRNIGSGGNTEKCFHRSEGKYIIWLSSDDYLEPNAIELMVRGLEMYPMASCAQGHRNEVDENGKIYETSPFYNQSCYIEGEDQAAVYMMAGIAVSSQTMFRKADYLRMLNSKQLRFQVAGDWYDNFMMACVGGVVYIKKPIINYRVHTGNETTDSERNLVGILEHYQLINAFVTIANSFGMTKPQQRYTEAIQKLARMCIRYAKKMILNEEISIAKKYLRLAPVFDIDIENEDEYIRICEVAYSDNPIENAKKIVETDIYKRTISYNPPENSIRIEELE